MTPQPHFEQGELIDNHGHERHYQMTGYTDGKETHWATGIYTWFGELVDIVEVEEIKK